MSAFNQRFSSGGVWFIQDKFAFMGNLIIETCHMAGSYGKCRLQAEYKMQTEYKMRLGTKCRLQTEYKIQTLGTKCRLTRTFFFVRNVVTFELPIVTQ